MISRSINASQVRLASDVADEFFPNIKGDPFREDVSWLATLRALLPSRLGNDIAAQIRYIQRETPSKKSMAARVEYMLEGVDLTTPYTITVVDIRKTTEDMEKIKEAFVKKGIPDHVLDEAVFDRFYKNERPEYTMIYCNQDIANTVIIVDACTMSKWHTLQGFMRRFWHKLFMVDKPLNDKEFSMLKLLASDTKDNKTDEYLALMEEFAEPYDFRSAIIRKSLTGFTTAARKGRIRTLERSIEDTTNRIKKAQTDIGNWLATRHKSQIELYGLRFSLEQDDSGKELTEYFLNNKQLVFTDVEGNRFNFWTKSKLTYWDQSDAESYIATAQGYLYEGARTYHLDQDTFKTLLKHIFIDRSVTVLMCASYVFQFDGDSVNINIDSSSNMPPELKGYMMNPHSMGNNCWGDHSRNLSEALEDGDYAGAVGVCLAATAQLTLHDVSTRKFSEWLAKSDIPCLQLADGKRMTAKEYLETL